MSYIEEHKPDHCKTVQDVRAAAIKVMAFRNISYRAVDDPGIDLKRPHGITGYEVERDALVASQWATIAALREKIKKLEDSTISLERDWVVIQANSKRLNKWPHNFIHRIKKLVASKYFTNLIELESARRGSCVVFPRHIAMYLCKQLTLHSLPEIGRQFGNRDHSTALYAIRKISKRMLTDPNLCQTVSELQSRLEQDLAKWRAAC